MASGGDGAEEMVLFRHVLARGVTFPEDVLEDGLGYSVCGIRHVEGAGASALSCSQFLLKSIASLLDAVNLAIESVDTGVPFSDA